MVGFAGNAGIDSAIGAELKAIRFALQIAWERDCIEIVIERDSLLAIHKILKADIGLDHHRALIAGCWTFLKKPWKVSIQHVLREGNSCADILANWGMSLQVDIQV